MRREIWVKPGLPPWGRTSASAKCRHRANPAQRLLRIPWSQQTNHVQDRNFVLVVDDDLGVLKGVQRLLRVHAYDPILFSTAQAFKNHTE